MLDDDNLRHSLCRNLGFDPDDWTENVRQAAEVVRMMAEAGLIVLVSPSWTDRAMTWVIAGELPFLEVFVDTPLSVCETRDPKGCMRGPGRVQS